MNSGEISFSFCEPVRNEAANNFAVAVRERIEFAELKTEALKMGFRHVESGPLVRSSYHAHEQAASTGMMALA